MEPQSWPFWGHPLDPDCLLPSPMPGKPGFTARTGQTPRPSPSSFTGKQVEKEARLAWQVFCANTIICNSGSETQARGLASCSGQTVLGNTLACGPPSCTRDQLLCPTQQCSLHTPGQSQARVQQSSNAQQEDLIPSHPCHLGRACLVTDSLQPQLCTLNGETNHHLAILTQKYDFLPR